MSVDTRVGVHTIGEILSQPDTWARCCTLLENSGELSQASTALPGNVEWVFVGCGSSFFLAEIAAATWSMETGERARALPASEILLFPSLFPQPSQPVLISRSGETSEVVEAAAWFRQNHSSQILGITCAQATRLEKFCDYIIRLSPADERSTVMSRSFTSMLLALQCLAAKRAGRVNVERVVHALRAETEKLLPSMQTTIDSLVRAGNSEDYVFLGQGPFFGVAQEAMLKVKEMSCSYAQSFHTLEFRHGPKAIVSPRTLVTFFLSEKGMEQELAVLEEVKSLGGQVLAITNLASSRMAGAADQVISLELDVPEPFRAAAAVIPAQLLGYYTGLRKGFDPDHPRHLTRVVMLQGTDGGGAGSGS